MGLELGQAVSATPRAWKAERGNSRSSRRNSATRSGVDGPPVGAEEGLVGRAAAQRGHPVARLLGVLEAGREHAGGHVDPLEAAAQDEEAPAVVAAHGGVGQPGQDGGPLLDVGEEGVGPDGHRAATIAGRAL